MPLSSPSRRAGVPIPFPRRSRPLPVRALAAAVLATIALAIPVPSAGAAPTDPKREFGFEVGADYHLINYQGLLAYWRKLAAESNRLTLVDIGRTAEDRPMVMAVVTSPGNQRRLGRLKEISRRLALAKGVSEAEARRLAGEGRAVVWIDGGLHATEVLGSQQLVELVWRLVSRNDPETLRILDDVVLLAVPANPDGMDLVADWYNRNPKLESRSTAGVPRLYQKYAGHDNNRDFYMVSQPESVAMSRQLYREWHPQILYNHHQTGPAGTVLFAPPFRDPFNYVFDPLVPMGIDLVSAAMHGRFVAEDKPGATMRSGAGYSTWWNGGLRSTGYFHNIIGILTEAIGNPTPVEIPFIPQRLLPRQDYPYPVAPQKWHFRQSVEYAITADMAILDVASRHREEFLYRRWLMGHNAIAKGSRDSWTMVPARVAEVEAAVRKDREKTAAAVASAPAAPAAPPAGAPPFGGRGRGIPSEYYERMFDKARRDPRGFVIPSDQPDFATATRFVNALLKSGCEVRRATADFAAAGKPYPKGSYVVKTDQAFRAHVLTMFEPQDHPNDLAYPGGPPNPPYDSAGWTLAFQMGVRFDRILDAFDGPFQVLDDVVSPPRGRVESKPGAAGWFLDRRANDAFAAVNRLVAAGAKVAWTKAPFDAGGRTRPAGTFFVSAWPAATAVLEKAARETGLAAEAAEAAPPVETVEVKPKRIGLWDVYGGSMDSGWIRWVLEEFAFPYQVVYAPDLDAGGLREKFDVLIFPGGAIPPFPARPDGPEDEWRRANQLKPEDVPEPFRARMGRVTVDKTLPKIREFLEQGGAAVVIGESCSLAYHLGLPVADALVETTASGERKPLPRERFYVPGSILRVRVDAASPLALGMTDAADVFFDQDPVFALLPDAELRGVRPVAWFGETNPLRSGWIWGDAYLRNGVAAFEAAVGRGRLAAFGPEITFRGQPYGTFKLLFNAILE